MTTTPPEPEWVWDEEVEITVRVRVRARPNPEFFEGWDDRTPTGAAITAILSGRTNFESMDGYADLFGEAYILDADEF